MPKGDRLKLKADPEDGTTPIANLLLEAVAMAKISGLQKGAVLYLWRRTYGWVEDGKRLKERKISLTEWKKSLDSSASRCSKALSDLEEHNIIHRRMADPWGGYYYQINTMIASWNQNCISIAKLAEQIGINDFATVDQNATVANIDNSYPKQHSGEMDNSYPKKNATVDQNDTQQLTKTTLPTLYKERLNKDKERGEVFKKPSLSPYGEGTKKVFDGLKERRGYKTNKNNAEAKSIRNMLKDNYTPGQILGAWDYIKRDKFYDDKELFMMTVEGQIGAVLKRKGNSRNQLATTDQLLKSTKEYYEDGK